MWTKRLKNASCQFDKHRPGIRNQTGGRTRSGDQSLLPGQERIMSRQLENYGINILQLHAEWLVATATSAKQQAASGRLE